MRLKFWKKDELTAEYVSNNYFLKRKRIARSRVRFPTKWGSLFETLLFGHFIDYEPELWNIYDATQRSLRLLFVLKSGEQFEALSKFDWKGGTLDLSATLIKLTEDHWYKRYGRLFYRRASAYSFMQYANFSNIGLFTRFFDNIYHDRVDPKWPVLPRKIEVLDGAERTLSYEEEVLDFDEQKLFYSNYTGSWLNFNVIGFISDRAYQRFRYVKSLQSSKTFIGGFFSSLYAKASSSDLIHDTRLGSNLSVSLPFNLLCAWDPRCTGYTGYLSYVQYTTLIGLSAYRATKGVVTAATKRLLHLAVRGWGDLASYADVVQFPTGWYLNFLAFLTVRLRLKPGLRRVYRLLRRPELLTYFDFLFKAACPPVFLTLPRFSLGTSNLVLWFRIGDVIEQAELTNYLRPSVLLPSDQDKFSALTVYRTIFADNFLLRKAGGTVKYASSALLFYANITRHVFLAYNKSSLGNLFRVPIYPHFSKCSWLFKFRANRRLVSAFFRVLCVGQCLLRFYPISWLIDTTPFIMLEEIARYPFRFTDMTEERLYFLIRFWMETKINNIYALRIVTHIGAGYPWSYEPQLYFWIYTRFLFSKFPRWWLHLLSYGGRRWRPHFLAAPLLGISFNRTTRTILFELYSRFRVFTALAVTLNYYILSSHNLDLFFNKFLVLCGEPKGVASVFSDFSFLPYAQLKLFLLSFFISDASFTRGQFKSRLHRSALLLVENRRLEFVVNGSKLVEASNTRHLNDSFSPLTLEGGLGARMLLVNPTSGLYDVEEFLRKKRFSAGGILSYTFDLQHVFTPLTPYLLSLNNSLLYASNFFNTADSLRTYGLEPFITHALVAFKAIPSSAISKLNATSGNIVEFARSGGVGLHAQFFRYFLPYYMSSVAGQLAKVSQNTTFQVLEGPNTKFLYYDNISEKFLKNELAFRASAKLESVIGLRRKDFSVFYMDNFVSLGFMNTFDASLYELSGSNDSSAVFFSGCPTADTVSHFLKLSIKTSKRSMVLAKCSFSFNTSARRTPARISRTFLIRPEIHYLAAWLDLELLYL